MNDIQVSVVMGVHNSPEFLDRTITSVLQQFDVRFELIIVDDGSNSETRELLGNYTKNSSVVLLRQEHLGLTKALILGCSNARGKYIARLDVGDCMLAGRLSSQFGLLESAPELGLVCSAVELVTEEDIHLQNLEFSNVELRAGLSNPLDLSGKTPFHSSVMFRRDVYQKVGGYRAEFYLAQDLDLWTRILEHAEVACSTECLTRAIFSSSGLSARYKDQQHQLREIIAQAIKHRKSQSSEKSLLEQASKIRPQVGSSSTSTFDGDYFIGKLLMENKSRFAQQYFIRALRQRPFSLKTWFAWIKSSILVNT